MRAPPAPPKVITGVVERITFQNEETGYTIAKLLADQRDQRSAPTSGRDDPGLTTLVGRSLASPRVKRSNSPVTGTTMITTAGSS